MPHVDIYHFIIHQLFHFSRPYLFLEATDRDTMHVYVDTLHLTI